MQLGLVDVRAPNGQRWDYHVVHLGRIAITLIVDDQNRVLMLWRYRFITEQWGEPEHLVSFEPLSGQVTAPIDVFLWRGAEQVGDPTDTEEVGRVEWVLLSRVPELAARQELLGSGTLVALLYYLPHTWALLPGSTRRS